jgi:hypothetical protein
MLARMIIETAHLFLPLQNELVALLRSLEPGQWLSPTVAGEWRVREVAAHLLDGDLRRLSMHRDGHVPPPPESPIEGYRDLVAFLNGLNASWVNACARLSPRVITDLLEWTGPQMAELFESLPPHGEAVFPVAWAGEDRSKNWMDIGREYTEKWHHQAQIRAAVGAPGLLAREWLYPVFALSLFALPHAFREVEAPSGSALQIVIEGDAGGSWLLVREDSAWTLNEGAVAAAATARVVMDAEAAWRLFYNALGMQEAKRRIEATGEASLTDAFLATRSVMV